MNAANDNAARKGLRGWWASPPRPGMQRLINPWEYRHLRAFGVTRIAGGFVAATAGVVCETKTIGETGAARPGYRPTGMTWAVSWAARSGARDQQ